MSQVMDVGRIFSPPIQENETGTAQQPPFTGIDLKTEFPPTVAPFIKTPDAADGAGTVQYAVHHDQIPVKREAAPDKNMEQQIDALVGKLAGAEQFASSLVQWRNELLNGVTDRFRTLVAAELQTTARDLAQSVYELHRQKNFIIEESSSAHRVVDMVNEQVCEMLAQRLRQAADEQIRQQRARRTSLRAYDPAFASDEEQARQVEQKALLQKDVPTWRVAPVDGRTDQKGLVDGLQALTTRLETEIATLRATRSQVGAAALPTSEDGSSVRDAQTEDALNGGE